MDIERRKVVQARARERAAKARAKQTERKRGPTDAQLCKDLVRVAEDAECNPWAEFRSISRRRYELYGHYPVELIDQRWGTFARAMEVAGLRDQVGTRIGRANRAVQDRGEQVAEYCRRYVQPYVAQIDKFRELHEPYLLLSISDTHATFLDPFVWHAFLSAIRDLRPSGVLLNGDILEGSAISRHQPIPGWQLDLQAELDFLREMVRQIRELHDGHLFLTGGNHGVDRLASYLSSVAPALAGLRSLRIDELLGLGSYNVQLFQGGTIASPQGEEEVKHGFLLWGHYRIHHGTSTGMNPARSELLAAGRSGQSGHVHRAQLAFRTDEHSGHSWMSTPCGCTERAARSYIKGVAQWQRGFGIAWLFPGGGCHQYPVVVCPGKSERIVVEGHIYSRPPDQRDPDPRRCWLSDVPLPRG